MQLRESRNYSYLRTFRTQVSCQSPARYGFMKGMFVLRVPRRAASTGNFLNLGSGDGEGNGGRGATNVRPK